MSNEEILDKYDEERTMILNTYGVLPVDFDKYWMENNPDEVESILC